MCGCRIIAFEDLSAFVGALKLSGAIELVEEEFRGRVARAAILLVLITAHKRVRFGVSILDLVKPGDVLLATDPRDKIYGFLAHADNQIREKIKVDYRKCPAEIYLDAAKYSVETDPHLNILHNTEREHSTADASIYPHLPSWCPNFNGRRQRKRLPKDFHAGFEEQPAQDTSMVPYARVLNDNVLVRGFHIETVEHIEESEWRWCEKRPIFDGLSSIGQSLS